ncbi:MAG: polysaccharide biosynthesis tyrosine autokinase [Pyrinomonadaceae bacterium]|nr:polysaccharide biosynthesis tyrosine autokinase [Pyrinomonadaceae bacterium]
MRKHQWLIVGITLLFTILSAIYAARKPDIYEAQARVQVDLENAQSRQGGAVIVSGTSDPAYFNTQLQILTGPGLLRRVVKTLDLEHDDAFLRPQSAGSTTLQNLLRMVGLGSAARKETKDSESKDIPLVDSVASPTSYNDLAEAKRLAPHVGVLQASLDVNPVRETRVQSRDTRLIDVRFKHPDPQVAAKVVNAIVEAYRLSNMERRNETSNQTTEFLQRRIAELQSQIRNDEERLLSYSKSRAILSLSPDQNTVVDRLSKLNNQLVEAENQRKNAKAALDSYLQQPDAVAGLVEGTARYSDAEVKLSELQRQRAQLLVEYTEEWPDVKQIDQQIAVLEKRVRESRNRGTTTFMTSLEAAYSRAFAYEQSLRESFNQQRSEVLSQNESAINYRIIQQQIDTSKNLLNGLLQRSAENNMLAAGTPNNIHIIDYSLVPELPVGPKRTQSVMLAFFFSLVFGVGLALFLDYLDDTIGSAEDVEKMLHLPALAAIPAIGNVSRRLLPGGSAAQTLDANSALLLHSDTRSSLAEAYRQLRTSVLLSTAGRAPKTLLVTSSLPSEGKTTTAANTALSLAQTGAKVLIVDADMRRPRLHSIFKVDNHFGLSSALSTETSEAEVLKIISRHEESGLYVLASGPVPPNPAELIGSEQMRRLLGILEANFTHVVVDSPPIASFTDGVLIASMVDGVLLVLHGGKSSRDVARRSRQLLQDVGAKIFGVVLNNVSLRSHDYSYYQQYYNSSYNDEDEDGMIVNTKA